MPQGLSGDSKVYVVIDEDNEVQEIHENNNIGWALINPNLGMATSNKGFISELPEKKILHQNYPNPFNPATNIVYQIPEQADVTLKVYSVTGRLVATLVQNTVQQAGQYTVAFDATDLASGVYLYRLEAGNFTQTQRMMLIK